MSWIPLNLAAAEFSRRTLPPGHLGLVYAGRRHVVSGPPESAKTLLAWIVALDVARTGGGVACVDFEMGPHGTRELLANLGWALAEIESVHYVEPDGPPTESDLRGLVEDGVTFAIIDSAAGAFDASQLDDNKRQDAQKFARTWIDPLWKRGITTLLVDHVTKNADTRGKFAIGSERKVGTADVHLGLETIRTLTRGGSGLVKVHVHKDRQGWLRRPVVAELALHSDPDTHAISWEIREPASATANANGWRPTFIMEKVSRFLEQQPEPVSRAAVERAGLGKSRDHIRQAMDALLADGCATETAGLRGARMLTSAKPFRTSPDLALTSPGEDIATSPTSPSAYRRGEVTGEDEVASWPTGEDIVPLPDNEPDLTLTDFDEQSPFEAVGW